MSGAPAGLRSARAAERRHRTPLGRPIGVVDLGGETEIHIREHGALADELADRLIGCVEVGSRRLRLGLVDDCLGTGSDRGKGVVVAEALLCRIGLDRRLADIRQPQGIGLDEQDTRLPITDNVELDIFFPI